MNGLLAVMREVGGDRMATEDLRDLQSHICDAIKAPKADPGEIVGYIFLSARISAILAGREPKTGG